MKFPLRNLLVATTIAFSTAFTSAFADSASDFADEASAKGIAEIQTGRLALEKSSSADIKAFAQKMIDEHTSSNRELVNVAKNAKVKLSDEATLADKAKKLILEHRDGSFDAAFAENQVKAHEATIELYQEYIRDGENNYLKAYAKETLPKLQHHLEAAKELHVKHP